MYLGDEMNELYSHESFGFQYSRSEKVSSTMDTFHKMYVIDSPTFVINEETSCLNNQPSENFNQLNDVNVYYPNINNLVYSRKNDNLYTSFDVIDSSQVGYLKFKFKEIYQEKKTHYFQPMVISNSLDLVTIS